MFYSHLPANHTIIRIMDVFAFIFNGFNTASVFAINVCLETLCIMTLSGKRKRALLRSNHRRGITDGSHLLPVNIRNG